MNLSITETMKCYCKFGGVFMPESLIKPIGDLAAAFKVFSKDEDFIKEFHFLLNNFAGRPTALTEVLRLRAHFNGPRLFLKREDCLHTGAHKINNALGQCLLAKKMNKARIIAETGAGQHGVATATACAHLGLDCEIYMGKKDVQRQQLNVLKMRLLGGTIHEVDAGDQTLKEAVNAALRDYAANFTDTHYCLGSALGPYPYPKMVQYFQRIIGDELKQQCQSQYNITPDLIIACIGGGSNAIGVFSPFIDHQHVQLVGVEAGGSRNQLGEHAARFKSGKPGVLHGCYSYLLQDGAGQVANTHSISAGLDYPMIGPQHALLYESGRVHYSSVTDQQAVEALRALAQLEGIIPALESSHALAYYIQHACSLNPNINVVVNLSGRGDKDLPTLKQKGLL